MENKENNKIKNNDLTAHGSSFLKLKKFDKEDNINDIGEHLDTNNFGEFEKELWEAFQEFDIDGNGTIDKDEFALFMQKLGYRPTLVELQEMLDEVDKDRNGKIGFEDFKILMTRTIRDDFAQTSSIEAFSVFDKQKSGKINKNDLINILMTKGEFAMSQEEIEDLLKYVQFNEDNEINYAEFIRNTFDLFK